MTFRPVGAELFQAERRKTDRQTDVTKLTVAFRKLSNIPKAFALCNHVSNCHQRYITLAVLRVIQ